MQYAALVQADVVVDEEQEICGKGESVEEMDGGSILTRGVKFTSAEEFLSFMEEVTPEGVNGGENVEHEDEAVELNLSMGPKFVSEKVSLVDENGEKKEKQKRNITRVRKEKTRQKTL